MGWRRASGPNRRVRRVCSVALRRLRQPAPSAHAERAGQDRGASAIRSPPATGCPTSDAFPAQLQAALAAKGIAVEIANAGVSGDTASGGLARLDWSVPEGTDAVILELGANDMLRGLDPEVTRDALDAILRRLTERHIAVLLCGMRAAPNLGADYGAAFERDLSRARGEIRRAALSVLPRRRRRRSEASTSATACIRPPPAST